MNPVGNYDTGVGTLPGYDKKSEKEMHQSPEERVYAKNDLEGVGKDAQADVWASLVEEEANNDIKFRTMSWQKTALLLFGEYVCLAILALSWSYSVLGWTAGILVTLGLGLLTWYTSYIQWQYIMRNPGSIHNICDIAFYLLGAGTWGKIAYEITAIMLLLNNIFLMGFHVLTGSKILNTLSEHSQCTVVFSVITAIMGIIFSLPRTLNHVATMSIASAIAMAISLLLVMIYVGIEDHPGFGYGGTWPKKGAVVYTTATPDGSPGFINAFNAVLNITFLWIGQVLYPSFIAEMKRPQDFPKALAALTIAEFCLFTTVAVVGYYFTGQYATAPLVGSLQHPWMRKSSFAFVLVPTLIIGAIYSNVAAKFIYLRIMGKSRHAHSNSVVGWGVWIGVTIAIWAIAFVLGEAIPSMGDFLGIMSAAFDSWFGFIMWAVAYYAMNKDHLFKNAKWTLLTILNIFIFGLGLMMLGPGLWTSIEAIIVDYSGTLKVFTCADNSL